MLCRALQLVGVCEVGGLLMLVSEFVERGSLQNLLCLPELRWHARYSGGWPGYEAMIVTVRSSAPSDSHVPSSRHVAFLSSI